MGPTGMRDISVYATDLVLKMESLLIHWHDPDRPCKDIATAFCHILWLINPYIFIYPMEEDRSRRELTYKIMQSKGAGEICRMFH